MLQGDGISGSQHFEGSY